MQKDDRYRRPPRCLVDFQSGLIWFRPTITGNYKGKGGDNRRNKPASKGYSVNEPKIDTTHTHNRRIKDRMKKTRSKKEERIWEMTRESQKTIERFQSSSRLFLLEQTFLPFDRSKISRSKIAGGEYNLRVKKKKTIENCSGYNFTSAHWRIVS